MSLKGIGGATDFQSFVDGFQQVAILPFLRFGEGCHLLGDDALWKSV